MPGYGEGSQPASQPLAARHSSHMLSPQSAVLPAECSETAMMSPVPWPREGQGARGPAQRGRIPLPRGLLLEPRQLVRAGSAEDLIPKTHTWKHPPTPGRPPLPQLPTSVQFCSLLLSSNIL